MSEKYQCKFPQCGRTFKRTCELNRHIQMHPDPESPRKLRPRKCTSSKATDELKAYHCTEDPRCGFSTNHAAALKRHRKDRHGPHPRLPLDFPPPLTRPPEAMGLGPGYDKRVADVAEYMPLADYASTSRPPYDPYYLYGPATGEGITSLDIADYKPETFHSGGLCPEWLHLTARYEPYHEHT